jgi:hypothetical protein
VVDEPLRRLHQHDFAAGQVVAVVLELPLRRVERFGADHDPRIIDLQDDLPGRECGR